MAANPNDPRLRVNKTTDLVLTTNWQTVDFNGISTFNVNTFGKDSNGNPMVFYDPSTKLFKFMGDSDMNLMAFFFVRTSATLITTRSNLQYRLVIPNGGGPGVDTYFPFPDAGGYCDLAEITVLVGAMVNNRTEPIPLYVTQAVRTNGFRIEVRLSNALITLGIATLHNATFLIQSTGK